MLSEERRSAILCLICENSTKIKTNLKKTFPEVFRVSGQPLDSFDAVAAHDQVHGRDDLLGHRGRDGRGVAGGLRVDPQVVDQLEENGRRSEILVEETSLATDAGATTIGQKPEIQRVELAKSSNANK